MRTISLIWDVANQQLLNEATLAALRSEREWPFMTYKEQVLVMLTAVQLVDGIATAIPFPTDTVEYSAVIDLDYDYDTLPLVYCTASNINRTGDWEEDGYVGNADPSLGQMSLLLDGYVASFRNRLGTTEKSSKTYLEIKGKSSDSKLTFVYRIPFVARNLMDDETGVPPSVWENYGQRWAEGTDGKLYLASLFPDEVWRIQVPVILNGQPTHKWEVVEMEVES